MLFVFALALTLLAALVPSDAQQPGKVYRIGCLGGSAPATPEFERLWGPFREGLRERGYIEGQTFLSEYRWTGGQIERSPSLAAELVSLKVDLIVAAGNPRIRAASKPPARSPSSWCTS